jgi:large subunit ribosomal protein L11
MAKKIQKQIKVQAIGGKATPAPPLGPVLGQAGINIGEFINQFNAATQDRMGEIVPTIITVYEDRSFDLIYKEAPASAMVLKELGIKSGSGNNLTKKVGTLTKDQVRKIAEQKMPDLNAGSVEAAMKIVEGTCESMGVEVK